VYDVSVATHVAAALVGFGATFSLAFMMLLSRVVFQAAGPARMRSFLDGWQSGGVKRVWGAASLLFAVFLGIAAAATGEGLSGLDVTLLVALLLVLLADGLVNVSPGGFAEFKNRLQEAWVARRRGAGREGDRYLFGTVNALLALASVAVAALVIAYRPIEPETVGIAAGIALALTAGLMSASTHASRR
jgi:hypothetical protein